VTTTQPTRRQSRANLHWVLMALGLTALQAAAIFALSDRSTLQELARKPVPRVRVATWDIGTLLADPRLLALPTEHGFAGIGWRKASDPQYVAQDWTEPMPWLGQSETGLVRTLFAAEAAGIGRGVTADKPSPQFAANALPALPLAEQTVVRLDATGAHWEWAEPLVAPAISHSNILSETVVQVTADRSGQVFSAVVLKSSGLKAADQQAIELARTARFRITPGAADPEDWAWARLVFQWRTLAPGATGGETPARGS
jgi:TonB family protein